MSYTWRYETADGRELTAGELPDLAVTDGFPSQSDAESWIGESWRELQAGGIDAVSLLEDGRPVYGPMSLHAD